jgi:NADH:ubiquinone oxidoreductase subunit B-like Fe-S oxidoreductase
MFPLLVVVPGGTKSAEAVEKAIAMLNSNVRQWCATGIALYEAEETSAPRTC